MRTDEIRSLMLLARTSIRDGAFLRAVALTDQLATAAPDSPEAHLLRARALLGSGASDEAQAAAERAVALDDDLRDAHWLRAMAAWREDDLQTARHAMERALEIDDDAPELRAQYAWFLAANDQPLAAQIASVRAIVSAKNSPTAWSALALTQFRSGRLDDARSSVDKALALDAYHPIAQSVHAMLLLERNDRDGIVRLVERIEGMPGLEDLADELRDHLTARSPFRRLVEKIIRLARPHWLRYALTAVLAATSAAGLFALLQPQSSLGTLLCGAVPVCGLVGTRLLFR